MAGKKLSDGSVPAATTTAGLQLYGIQNGQTKRVDAGLLGGGPPSSGGSGTPASAFGILPSKSAAENSAAWAAAVAALRTKTLTDGDIQHIEFLSEDYYFNAPLDFDFPIHLSGRLPFAYSQQGTWLNFAGSDGVRLQGYGTSGVDVAGGNGIGAAGSLIHHLGLRGDYGASEAGLFHGIRCKTKAHVHDLAIGLFRGDAVNVFAHADLKNGNANGAVFRNIVSFSCRWGFNSGGPDANNMLFDQCSGFANRRGTWADFTLLGNMYRGGDSSGSAGLGTKDTYPTRVTHMGHAYAVKLGQEAWCKVNPPSGEPSSNQGWFYLGLSNLWQGSTNAWQNGRDYYFGAPAVSANVNATSHFLDIYVEGDQQPSVMTLPSRFTPAQTGDQGVVNQFGEPYSMLAMGTNGPIFRGLANWKFDSSIEAKGLLMKAANAGVFGGPTLDEWYMLEASGVLYFKQPGGGYVFRNSTGATIATLSNTGNLTINGTLTQSGSGGGGGGGTGNGTVQSPVADPGFADPSWWSATGGGEVSGGFAEFNMPYVGSNPNVYRAGALFTQGATYNYQFTISEYGGGSVRAFAGAETPGYGAVHAANGTHSGTLVAGGNGVYSPSVGLQGGADFIGKVDNFTLTLAT